MSWEISEDNSQALLYNLFESQVLTRGLQTPNSQTSGQPSMCAIPHVFLNSQIINPILSPHPTHLNLGLANRMNDHKLCFLPPQADAAAGAARTMKEECEAILAEAIPALNASVAALDTIKVGEYVSWRVHAGVGQFWVVW